MSVFISDSARVLTIPGISLRSNRQGLEHRPAILIPSRSGCLALSQLRHSGRLRDLLDRATSHLKRVDLDENWPASWKASYLYDLEEVYGRIKNRGYAYAYDRRRGATFSLVTEVLPPGARILDVAAAQGNFSIPLAELGYEVTWNDMRAELADYVRLKQEFGTIHFAPGNAFNIDLPLPFDGVLITEVIEHTAHPDQLLARAAQLVRPVVML